jgi:hypothetical protein
LKRVSAAQHRLAENENGLQQQVHQWNAAAYGVSSSAASASSILLQQVPAGVIQTMWQKGA